MSKIYSVEWEEYRDGNRIYDRKEFFTKDEAEKFVENKQKNAEKFDLVSMKEEELPEFSVVKKLGKGILVMEDGDVGAGCMIEVDPWGLSAIFCSNEMRKEWAVESNGDVDRLKQIMKNHFRYPIEDIGGYISGRFEHGYTEMDIGSLLGGDVLIDANIKKHNGIVKVDASWD